MEILWRSWRRILALASVLAVVLAVGLGADAPDTFAQASPGSVLAPSTNPYGQSYGEWSVKWWQCAVSIPGSNRPLLDTGPCSVAQSGPVWFLGGRFSGGSATRSCAVPPGTALFFPLVNTLDDNIGRTPPLFS